MGLRDAIKWEGKRTRLQGKPAVWRKVRPGPGYPWHWERFPITDAGELSDFATGEREARRVAGEKGAATRAANRRSQERQQSAIFSFSQGIVGALDENEDKKESKRGGVERE